MWTLGIEPTTFLLGLNYYTAISTKRENNREAGRQMERDIKRERQAER